MNLIPRKHYLLVLDGIKISVRKFRKYPLAKNLFIHDENEHFQKVSQNTRANLQKLFNLKSHEALELIESNKKLLIGSNELFKKNWELCKNHGINKSVVLQNSFVLLDGKLERKFIRIKQFEPLSLTTVFPFVNFGMRMLYYLTLNTEKTVARIQEISNIFEVSDELTCKTISDKPFMFVKPIEEIKIHLKLFDEYGIKKEPIFKDLWVLKYSEEFVKNRLSFMASRNLKSIKTWMIRCKEDILLRHVKRESDNRDILGNNSVAQYLSEKLECNEATAVSLIKNYPQLKNMSLLKMNMMIDLLCKQGFRTDHISKVPKILMHSTKTTEKRLKHLESLDIKVDSLYVLIKSKREYLKHIDNLIKIRAAEN